MSQGKQSCCQQSHSHQQLHLLETSEAVSQCMFHEKDASLTRQSDIFTLLVTSDVGQQGVSFTINHSST